MKYLTMSTFPSLESAFTQETSEPRENEGKCPENEEYRFCETCAKSCENPNPICPAQCMRGCFCVEGMLRNDKGLCVKPDECQNCESKTLKVNVYLIINVPSP